MNSAIAVAVALFASALAACTPPTPGAATDVQSAEQPDDAIRAAATEALQADIGQPIGLNIETLRTEGDWAWVIATPMTPSGEAVDFSATKYGQAVADGVFDGKPHSTINSTDLLNLIASMAWESGDPGVAFYNRINEDNVVNYLGDLSASNPCSELFLLPNESCCLGSINLLAFADENSPNKINLPFLEYIVRLAVRFLDNVQTVSDAPLEKINEVSKGLRRLGLGVMGWADLLAQLETPYDSEEAKIFGKRISWFISFFAWMESINLSKERGSFPLYDREKANLSVIEKTLNSSYTEQKFGLFQNP